MCNHTYNACCILNPIIVHAALAVRRAKMKNLLSVVQYTGSIPELNWFRVCTSVCKTKTNDRSYMIISKGATATLIIGDHDQTFIIPTKCLQDAKVAAEQIEAIFCKAQDIAMVCEY